MVAMQFPSDMNDTEIARMSADLGALLARKERFGVVMDGSKTITIDSRQRRRLLEVIEQHREDMQRYCVGEALILTSPLARGAVTALMWMRAPPVEVKVFSEIAAAENWLNARLRT